MGRIFGNFLPITYIEYSVILFFIGVAIAKPLDTLGKESNLLCCLSPHSSLLCHADTPTNRDGSLVGIELGMIAMAGFLCVSLGLVLCMCCKKAKGFAEFRGSTQLAELSPNQPGEVTLFPPPSLALNREDLEVNFEPLPRPDQQANTYRPKEITEWIGK